MSLGQNLSVTVGQFRRLIYDKVSDVLSRNWKAGLIDAGDVDGYLGVIRSGNFPTRNQLVVGPTEQAVTDFLGNVEQNKIGSLKPAGATTGLEGVDGFLSSVWDGIKDVGGQILGGGGPGGAPAPVVIKPTLTIPPGVIEAQVGPGAAQAAASGLGQWLPYIGLGVAAVFILPKLLKG